MIGSKFHHVDWVFSVQKVGSNRRFRVRWIESIRSSLTNRVESLKSKGNNAWHLVWLWFLFCVNLAKDNQKRYSMHHHLLNKGEDTCSLKCRYNLLQKDLWVLYKGPKSPTKDKFYFTRYILHWYFYALIDLLESCQPVVLPHHTAILWCSKLQGLTTFKI